MVDLSDFDSGMIVGARQAGLSISVIADLLGFSRSLESAKNKNRLVSGSSVDRKASLMSKENGLTGLSRQKGYGN